MFFKFWNCNTWRNHKWELFIRPVRSRVKISGLTSGLESGTPTAIVSSRGTSCGTDPRGCSSNCKIHGRSAIVDWDRYPDSISLRSRMAISKLWARSSAESNRIVGSASRARSWCGVNCLLSVSPSSDVCKTWKLIKLSDQIRRTSQKLQAVTTNF